MSGPVDERMRRDFERIDEMVRSGCGRSRQPCGRVRGRRSWEHEKPCDNAAGPMVDYDHLPEESGQKWRCEAGRMIGHPESNKPGEVGGVCEKCNGTGRVERIEPRLVPTGERIDQVLARHFGIDLTEIEAEKRAMLATLADRTRS